MYSPLYLVFFKALLDMPGDQLTSDRRSTLVPVSRVSVSDAGPNAGGGAARWLVAKAAASDLQFAHAGLPSIRVPSGYVWVDFSHQRQHLPMRFSDARSKLPTLLWMFMFLLLWPIARLQAEDASIARAAQLLQDGRAREAEVMLRDLALRHPGDASVHGLLGVVLAQQGELASAAKEYRASLALNAHQPEVSLNLGIVEFKQGAFGDAIPAFKAAARGKPEDPRSILLLGMSYYGLRRYAEAVPYLQRASRNDQGNLELHNVLAQSCLWSRQFDCAMTEFQSILTTDPSAAEAHMLLAEALDGMGRTNDAIRELETVARLAPQQPVLHFELGYLYYKNRDYEHAVPELQLEVKNNPGYAQAYLYLGDIAMNSNDDATAEPLLRKSVQLQSDLRLGYFDLGVIDSRENKTQAAVMNFEHAVKLDPSQPDAHYRLGRLYTALGQKTKARDEFAKTNALHSKTNETLIEKVSGTRAAAPK